MKRILILLFISLLFFNQSFAQKKTQVDESELKETAENIENLIKRDSLNTLIIQELKSKLDSNQSGSSPAILNTSVPPVTTSKGATSGSRDSSLWLYLLLAMSSGFIALMTPCVYPMVPMTVSFFTNKSQNRKEAIFKAFVYGLSIVVIYSLLGLVPAAFYGVEYANLLSTHWLTNIVFFVVFILFGMSFLGMFEITLPSSLVNKVDAQADKGGYSGIFFMAFTLVLVSFSCTAPFVGTILIEAQGDLAIKPILGMLAYSVTFATPFTIFAMFPSLLKSLPKSGGWLNEIKVTLGFVELALAFKFLSVADLVYHWGILDREIFIAIWIVLSILLGAYLLGKLKFSHDSEVKHTSVARLMMSLIPFVFAVYMLPGMFGAPLKALSGLLPPMDRHDFDLPKLIAKNNSAFSNKSENNKLCDQPKYSDILHFPLDLQGYFDYAQAIQCAKEKNLPVFIDFTGHGCANCRRMEANVWSDSKVFGILNNDYVLVALYVDERKELPESEWVTGSDGSIKKTLGKINHNLEISRYNNAAQPYYVLLNPFTEEPLVKEIIGSEPDINKFVQYLEEGKKNFKAYKK